MSNAAGANQPLPAELGKHLEDSLTHLVDSSKPSAVPKTAEGAADTEHPNDAIHVAPKKGRSWIAHLFPNQETVHNLFAMEHLGNYVIDRTSGKKVFEAMPLYVRVGMHLLFITGSGYLTYPSIESLLENQSIKQGELYDQTGDDVLPHIQSFINTYQLPLDELLVSDLTKYPTFNAFFSRRLKATARPITSPSDPLIITSPADCRLTVFSSVDQAKKLWIKGQEFSIQSLLVGDDKADKSFSALTEDPGCSIAVARLAPQDYHRYHSPVEGTVVSIKDIHGELYTVNPQAVNENLNVFTRNKRSIMLIHANLGPGREEVPIALVSVGAMLVGSIGWSKKPGDKILKGEELGWFQYGGSTNIVVFPSSAGIQFDQDLCANSEASVETVVRVGMEIGAITKQ
ncbi:phosphatidylserine decarboxylase-domain-containing protein [Dioszegia hungarica]|uniref:phosphatidylserine decarboxylase n=1 Tax=Dioszegia hungarica TaxID=4972 RepID=A0AA38LVD2_9TREE|nr:phosphatidylserine decarboxylase-domain-containing protein [Dioszegia hungarica]KAI9635579.1 phosphatidylserine decarboxylase-domain-containing protein [Dioszegia hungarica]